MPFRSLSTLQSWLDEFRGLGYPIAGYVKVIQQDGAEGANTGLVAFRFENAATLAYIQPDAAGSGEWLVTMEPREGPVTLNAASVRDLASELAMLSALCEFLQAKSKAFLGQDSA